MNRLKKFLRLFGIASIVAIAAGTGLAYAQTTVTGLNETTGPFSRNVSRVNSDRLLNVLVENNQRLLHDFFFNVDSGRNETERNTVVGDQATGDVNVDVTADNGGLTNNFLGDAVLPIDLGISNVDFTGANQLTGPNSLNRNIANLDQRVRIDLQNRSTVRNDLDVRANTGDNETERNTLVGDVASGNIDITGTVGGSGTAAVAPMIDLGLNDNNVTSELSNAITGPNSDNENRLNADTILNLRVLNNQRFTNDVDVRANTGRNEVENNTSVGDVTTGDISVNVDSTF